MLQRYFDATTFSVYEDIEEPIIGFSRDGTLAWAIFQVRVAGGGSGASASAQAFDTQWAWLTLYERRKDGWARIADVSTDRPFADSDSTNTANPANTTATGSSAYQNTLAVIQRERVALLQQYESARSDAVREAILDQATVQLVQAVRHQVTPFWQGTPWEFNGTTQIPGTGAIACGYFVTTVLRDLGVSLDRVRLAQQPSEAIIKSLVGPDAVRRFSDVPLTTFLDDIRAWGHGLYIVGLDIHVGFIVHDDAGTRFIHSSYLEPACVVDEPAADSVILADSRYRVLGKLTADRDFLLSWLRSGG
jgi:hypothetical protein